MKVVKDSSLSKLFAAKFDPATNRVNPSDNKAQALKSAEKSLQSGVANTSDAAATITRVASQAGSESSQASEAKRRTSKDREDVASEIKAASNTSVEDVTRLADQLAQRIRQNPNAAVDAHSQLSTESLRTLLH